MELEPGERGQRGREHQRSRRIGLLGFGELGRREFEDDQAFIKQEELSVIFQLKDTCSISASSSSWNTDMLETAKEETVK